MTVEFHFFIQLWRVLDMLSNSQREKGWDTSTEGGLEAKPQVLAVLYEDTATLAYSQIKFICYGTSSPLQRPLKSGCVTSSCRCGKSL